MQLSDREKKLLQLTDEQLTKFEAKFPQAVLRTRINKILLSDLPADQKKEQARQLILASGNKTPSSDA